MGKRGASEPTGGDEADIFGPDDDDDGLDAPGDDDADQDGTPDCNDLCPDDPLKTEPGTCGCGVPDDDSDQDGTPDCDDRFSALLGFRELARPSRSARRRRCPPR